MHLDGLLILAPDDRNPHPNIGFASLRIPTLDLKIQWLALGRETDVLSPGLRLAEIEIVLVQTNQYREVFQDCRGRQVRPSGIRDEIHRARMFPVAILCQSLGKESGKKQKKNQSGQEVYRIHFSPLSLFGLLFLVLRSSQSLPKDYLSDFNTQFLSTEWVAVDTAYHPSLTPSTSLHRQG